MAVDIANLSSNWKALQERLKEQASSDKQPLKSKPAASSSRSKPHREPNGVHPISHNPLKRKLPSIAPSNLGNQKKKANPKPVSSMGSTASSQRHTDPTTNPTNTSPSLHNYHPPDRSVTTNATTDPPKPQPPTPGRHIALDTEMVGTLAHPPHALPPSRHPPHTYSILARVSLCTYDLQTLYDAYVLPPSDTPVADYRTPFSGITAWHLNPRNKSTNPKPLAVVQREVAALLQHRVLIGHDLPGDLAVLGLTHPKADTRDTAYFPQFRLFAAGAAPVPGLSRREGGLGKKGSAANVAARNHGQVMAGKKPSLKMLAQDYCGLEIQKGGTGHDSVEDARATMAVYKRVKTEFDQWIVGRFGVGRVTMGRRSKNAVGEIAKVDHRSKVDAEAEDDSEGETTVDGSANDQEADGSDSEAQGPVRQKKPRKRKKKKGKYRCGGG